MTNIDTDAPGFLGHQVNDAKRLQEIPIVREATNEAMAKLRLTTLFDICVDTKAHIMISGPENPHAAVMLEAWAIHRGIVLERERFDPPEDAIDPRPYVTFRATGNGVAGFCISVLAAVYL